MTEKPWLDHYDLGVAKTLEPYPPKTLLDCLQETADERPDHPMLIFKGTRLSYGEMADLTDRFANALISLGVGPDQRVAILLPNCPQTVVAQFGAWKAGAVAAMLNPLYTEDEIADLLNECDAKTVIVLTPFYEKVKSIQSKNAGKACNSGQYQIVFATHSKSSVHLAEGKKRRASR